MYVVTQTDLNIVLDVCADIEYLDNGYPCNSETKVSYVVGFVNVNVVDEIPDGVERIKYCYTPAEGFYKNPNYVEPSKYGIPDALVEQIKNDAIAEVEEAVLNGTDK